MGGKTRSTSTTTNQNAVGQYNSAVSRLGNSSYKPLTAGMIDQYQSPYTSSVIDATLARSNQNRQISLNGNQDAAIAAGAFNGTGQSVADALTRGQYDLNDQQSIANLNNQNYSQALGTASAQNAAANQYPLAIQALLGQLAQGTKTTTNGTQSQPFDWAGALQGAGSIAQGAAMFSDRRLKRDISPLGERNGRKWYQFKYLWDDIVHEGVMAQENLDVAVMLPCGFYAVDYGAI